MLALVSSGCADSRTTGTQADAGPAPTAAPIVVETSTSLPPPPPQPELRLPAWNGYSGAVTWTFDDGFRSHLEVIAPMFAEMGIGVTFYPTCASIVFDPEGWQAVADLGHEVANHTMTGLAAGPETDIEEIAGCDTVIEEIIGGNSATFAYPDGVVDEPYLSYSQENHLAARGVDLPFESLQTGIFDWYDVPAFGLGGDPTVGPDGEILNAESGIATLEDQQGWLTLLVHAVDESGFARISRSEIEELLAAIAERDLWQASFVDVATHGRMREAFRRLVPERIEGGWQFSWVAIGGMSDVAIRIGLSDGHLEQNGTPVPVEDGFALIDARVGAFRWFPD